MGWGLRIGAFFVGLVCLFIGLWPISLLCFGWLIYLLWGATRSRRVYVMDSTGRTPEAPQPQKPGRFQKRYIAAFLFVLLALIALGEHGTYSPVVFFSIGALIVLSGVLHFGPSLSTVKPVPGSILLRSGWMPFSWMSLVEVKFGTSQMAKVLSSIGSEMLLTTDSEKISVYLPISVFALSMHEADCAAVEKLAPIARALSAKGAFVLPLDANEAAARLNWSLKPVNLALEYSRNGVVSLNSTPFDVLVMQPDGHLLKSAAGYVKVPSTKEASILPSAGPKLKSQPLVWEALEVLGEKFQVKEADAYTNFLSSVCATQGEGLDDRLVNEGRDGSVTVMISSLGAAQIELTRPQLRAIVRVYG